MTHNRPSHGANEGMNEHCFLYIVDSNEEKERKGNGGEGVGD